MYTHYLLKIEQHYTLAVANKKAVYIWLILSQILTDFDNMRLDEMGATAEYSAFLVILKTWNGKNDKHS